MPITSHLRKALLRNREIITMDSGVVDPGETRETKSQNSTDPVGKRYSCFIDDAWLTGVLGKLVDQKVAEESGSVPNAWSGTVRFATLTDSRATYPLESAAIGVDRNMKYRAE